jgi:outer membrane cobalamin receptor
LSYEFGLNFTGTQTSGLGIDRFEYYVYPKVNLQAELLKRTLAVYGGWDGTAKQNTLEGMIAQVPFLSMDQEYRLSGSNKGYVGMQGALAGKLQYRVEASLVTMNDALMFQRDSLLMLSEVNGQQIAALQAVYAENVVKTGVRGELNLPLKHFVASTYAEINNYSRDAFLGQEGRVLGAMVDYSINELSIGANLRYVGGRFNSLDYTLYPLEDYMDLSARVDYKINENLIVSLRGYNLLNQRYMMWQGYGVRGTRGMFVLNYQF